MQRKSNYLYLLLIILILTGFGYILFRYTISSLAISLMGITIISLIAWLLTTFKQSIDSKRILSLYNLTLIVLMIHLIEEYFMDFPGSIGMTFKINFHMDIFIIIIIMAGYILWITGGMLLYYGNPLGYYISWLLFLGMIPVQLSHFYYPLVEGGSYHYYPGMYTALLPVITSGIGIYRIIKDYRKYSIS